MTQIEDMLRTALVTTPTPQTQLADPLADLSRRVARRRLQISGLAVGVVAVVVAAVVVPLALVGSGTSTQTAKRPAVPVQPWAGHVVTGATMGGGFVWTLTNKRTRHATYGVVQRRDPDSGGVTRTYRVPDGEQFLAYGLGRVWTWGGGDGAYPHGELTVVSPATGHTTTVDLGYGKGLTTSAYAYTADAALAFAGGYAFGLRENNGGIVRFDPHHLHSAGPTQPVQRAGDAQSLLGSGDTLSTLDQHGLMGQWTIGAEWPQQNPPGDPVQATDFPLAVTSDGYWVARGGGLVHERSDGTQVGAAIPIPPGHGATFVPNPVSVVIDANGGLYAGLPKPGPSGISLLYYSPAALRAHHPTPTAVGQTNGGVDKLVADPAGGVVVASGSLLAGKASIGRWDPAAG
jgi:hypothetical protein